MNEIAKSMADRRREARQYSKTNRAEWESLGFRYITVLCHDSEREIMLAQMDMRKFEKMIGMAENPATTDDTIKALSRKNLTKVPTAAEIKVAAEGGGYTKYRSQIAELVENARYYVKKYHGLESAYESTASIATKLRVEAKAVAYSGAANACIRLATAMAASGEVDPKAKVFS